MKILKIKKSVDLKELRKFGYERDLDSSFSFHKSSYIQGWDIYIDSGTRQIHEHYRGIGCNYTNLKYIDDITEAGLVEEVEYGTN